jgi:tetratricopeptide (TPR) repeat protein
LSLRLILPQLERVADAQELVRALHGEAALPAGFEGGEGRLESLGACVHYSFRHLPEEDQDRLPALTLFEGVADVNILAMLSKVEGIPKRFRGIEKVSWKRLLDRCAGLGLLTSIGASMYRIHPALPAYLVALWRLRAGAGYAEELEAARLASVRAHAALSILLDQQIQGGDAANALAVLAAERRTLGIVVAEALGRRLFEEAQAILQPLNEFWDARGLREEARAWVDRCRELLEDLEGRPPDFDTPQGALWLFMVSSQANRSYRLGALDESEAEYDMLRTALEKAGGETARRQLPVVYHMFGSMSRARGDLAGAESWYRKSLAISESLGNRLGMAGTYHQLGWVSQDRGDLTGAESWYRESLAISESLGNRPGMAMTYHQLGLVSQDRGDLAGAESWYRKSLEISKSLGNRSGMAMTYHQLGIVSQVRGDLAGAESWYRKTLEINESLENRPGMVLTYANLGALADARGDSIGALDWTVRCVALFPEFPHPLTGKASSNLAVLTARLGMEALEEAWKRCTGKLLPEAVRMWVEARLAENRDS